MLYLLLAQGCGDEIHTKTEQPLPESSPEVGCTVDRDCSFGSGCVDGWCVGAAGEAGTDAGCVADAECPAGFACATSSSQCVEIADSPEPDPDIADSCVTGEIRPCGSKVGRCEYGVQSCVGGDWAAECVGGLGPIAEACNGVDDDCDGAVDPSELDGDDDGVRACDGDCDDTEPAVHAGAVELCDDLDNDCDPLTADGAQEAGFGDACDGADSDLCAEGVIACAGSALYCTDTSGDNLDLCDGVDNDCDPATTDGFHMATFGNACDGADSDLCAEGTIACDGTALYCGDNTGNDLELCDGVDNDCDPATADGAHEATFGDICDGLDADLCDEGSIACNGTALFCTDTSGDGLELCDGVDNDCDPATVDGSAEPTFDDTCDGADSDLCAEGVIACDGLALFCDDLTGGNVELCDGTDNDCDPATADGAGDAGVGVGCDGSDSDLCSDDSTICTAGAIVCGDGSDSPDLCNGFDDDCNGATADGADQDCSPATAGDPCLDGICSGGSCVAVDNGTCNPCDSGSPTADAGPDQTGIVPNTTVQLDGSGSTDPNGDPLTYSWRITSQPVGSSATLSDPTIVIPTILGDVSGDFVICLSVSDTNGCASAFEDCMTLNVEPAPATGLHIELVWFSDDSDVDLHYLADNGAFFDTATSPDGPDCHYLRKNPDWGDAGTGLPDGDATNDPILDVDNIDGHGPENINHDVLFDTAAPFLVGVHYYADKGISGPVNARVRIYVSGSLAFEKTATLSCQEIWEVAAIEVTGGGTTVTVTDLGLGMTPSTTGSCTTSGDPPSNEAGLCSDGSDNDGDGDTDCDDPDCATDYACTETGRCTDGIDDDGDGNTDCDDPDCATDFACSETGRCADGADNDGDGDTDCADSDCAADIACFVCPGTDLGSTLGSPVQSGTTVGAGADLGGSCSSGSSGVGAEDRAFAWTAPWDGTFVFDTDGSAFDTVLYLLDGTCSGSEIACDDDSGAGTQSLLSLALTAGQTVVVVVDGYSGAGAYVLNINATEAGLCADSVDNDADGDTDCADSDCAGDPACVSCPDTDLGSATGSPVQTGSTVGAGADLTGSCSSGSAGAEDLAFSWTAPSNGTYTFDTDGSIYDTVLYVLDGTCSGAEIACDDDSGAGTQSSITLNLSAGQTVIVVVDGYGGAGDFVLNVN